MLTNSFQSIECACLPYPGEQVTDGKFNGEISKVSPNFLKHVTVFVEDLIFSLFPSNSKNRMTRNDFGMYYLMRSK